MSQLLYFSNIADYRRSMSETRSKNLSDASNIAGKIGAKRGPQHSTEPNRAFKSIRTNGSNVGIRRGGTASRHHRDAVTGPRAQPTRPITRSLRSTRPNPTTTPESQGWTGQLVENPPFVAPLKPVASLKEKKVNGENNQVPAKHEEVSTVKKPQQQPVTSRTEPVEARAGSNARQDPNAVTRNPAELCSNEFLRAHPALAHLYAPEPVPNASTQTQNMPSQATNSHASETTSPSAPQNGSLMDTVDERELGTLSNNFAAMTITPRPAAPTPVRGIMASSHAVTPGSPRSTASVAPSNTTSHSVYVEATSSADNFWKWKGKQVPNRAGH